jgi:hypothetical protein
LIPNYQFDHAEELAELSELDGYDPTFTLCYIGKWNHWEEGACVSIYEKDGQYYEVSFGHSVHGDYGIPLVYEPISLERALELIDDLEETEQVVSATPKF